MPTDALIVVEGSHDVEVVARLLKPDFHKAKDRTEVPLHWRRFIPTGLTQPNPLPIRVAHPVFLSAADGRAVLIRAAGSDSQIPTKLIADLKDLSGKIPAAVGIIIDADNHAPSERVAGINRALTAAGSALSFSGPPGTMACVGGCRCGVYVAPDNAAPGSIESLLLEGGAQNFPTLLGKARNYVQGIAEPDAPSGNTWNEFIKWDRSKAVLHATGAVLKPGRPIHASIEDDPWFSGTGLVTVELLRKFLTDLTAP